MSRTVVLVALLSLAPGPAATIAQSQSSPSTPAEASRDTSHYNLESGKPAIQGYDPVAYFPEGGGKAVAGKKELSVTHRGVTYWFSSRANLDRFKADPEHYEPTYGGWCASAMADGGRKVEIDPKNFKVTDGRLYLFYKSFFQDALDFWVKDEPKHIQSADASWKSLTGETPPE